MQESKQAVTKIISLVKLAENLLVVSSPLNYFGSFKVNRYFYLPTFHIRIKCYVHLNRYLITKTRLYNFDPHKPHFYIVKLGFVGVYIIFLISDQKHRLWVPVRTASSRRFLRLPTIYILSRNIKNIRIFFSENFHFLVVKSSVYLNRHVFVMYSILVSGSIRRRQMPGCLAKYRGIRCFPNACLVLLFC